MNPISLNTIVASMSRMSRFYVPHRVLWWNEDSDNIVLIPIPVGTPHAPVKYFPTPFKTSLTKVVRKLDSKELFSVAAPPLPPLTNKSDDSIRASYPMRRGVMKKRERRDSAPLQVRDQMYGWIEPIVSEIALDPSAVFGSNRIPEWIRQRASELNIGQARLRSALDQYLALACGKNALLPRLHRCGKRTASRRQTCKLGRKSANAKLGIVLEPGIPLSDLDKQRISSGWRLYLRDGHSVHDAYILTMGAHWADGTNLHQGRLIPVLKPPSQHPTLSQFRYWGPRGEGAKAAWEALLRPGEWEKKYRAQYGTARDGVKAVGQIGSGDSTSNDVNLVSVASRFKALGTAKVLRIHDVYSDCVTGVALSLEAPNEILALLAIFNAAIDKVEFCRRFGVDITADQFPNAVYRMYHYDNGELRTAGSIELLKSIGSNAEFVQAGRADLKAIPESGHRRFHKKLDHKIAGTTLGRQRERGEEASAIGACWTYWEYMHELILAIIYHNTVADASCLLTVEMRRDGVAPNRAAIHQWAIRKGYVASIPIDVDLLRARLLPAIKAVVRPNGIFLLRPDRDEKREIVRGARFIGPRAVKLQWLETARRRGTFDIEVRHDPDDLSRIWFVDGDGVHELINVSNDSVLINEGTLTDLLRIQDDDHLQKLIDQTEIDQADANFVIGRHQQDQSNRQAKRAEIRGTGRKVTKTELKSNLAANRAEEAKLIAGQLDPVSRAPKLKSMRSPQPDEDDSDACLTASEPAPLSVDELEADLDNFYAQGA